MQFHHFVVVGFIVAGLVWAVTGGKSGFNANPGVLALIGFGFVAFVVLLSGGA